MIETITVFAIAIIAIVTGYVSLQRQRKITARGIEVDGIVFDLDNDNLGDSTISYPIVRFVTQEQEWITQKASTSGHYKQGDRIVVTYDPEKPTDFFIKSSSYFNTPFIVTTVGVLLFCLGIYLLLFK